MSTAAITGIIVAAIGAVGGVLAYLQGRRTTQGSVGSSDAKTVFDGLKDGYSKLIEDALHRIELYKLDLDDMRNKLMQAEAEITVLREQAQRVLELDEELSRTEAALTKANASVEDLRKQVESLRRKATQ